ncbi:unnamed protein product [Spirodela intermedia]|uniref:Uncharacterized protein n=1 Tax=Spirodela intermedia TaxID=51605 RepID=A0A7I8IWH9_SPIIN|nr:unnamed protein product [Spirodela intermedia]CAA6661501.1 unnamed protein product [Spirodela intermedia]
MTTSSASPNHPSHSLREVNMADESPESKPEILQLSSWDAAGTTEYKDKYSRYQAAYVRRLKAKYFSKKAFDGGNIFDQETNIDGEIIKSGRWPCTRSFAEPARCLQDAGALPPASASETSSTGASRKHQQHHQKKSG